jgi:hypothetical protein
MAGRFSSHGNEKCPATGGRPSAQERAITNPGKGTSINSIMIRQKPTITKAVGTVAASSSPMRLSAAR